MIDLILSNISLGDTDKIDIEKLILNQINNAIKNQQLEK